MAKSDKGKSKADKSAKKAKKADTDVSAKAAKKASPKKSAKAAPESAASKAVKGIQTISQNPLVADVVAAALVSMAAALKDSKKAHQLAEGASEQLRTLSKEAAKDGNVMWDLARDVGRRTLEAIVSEQTKGGKATKGGAGKTKP